MDVKAYTLMDKYGKFFCHKKGDEIFTRDAPVPMYIWYTREEVEAFRDGWLEASELLAVEMIISVCPQQMLAARLYSCLKGNPMTMEEIVKEISDDSYDGYDFESALEIIGAEEVCEYYFV